MGRDLQNSFNQVRTCVEELNKLAKTAYKDLNGSQSDNVRTVVDYYYQQFAGQKSLESVHNGVRYYDTLDSIRMIECAKSYLRCFKGSF